VDEAKKRATESSNRYRWPTGVKVTVIFTTVTSVLPLLYVPFDDESPFRSAAFDIALTISIWFASELVNSLNGALKEFHGDQEKVMLEFFAEFFSSPGLSRSWVFEISLLLRAYRLQIAIKKALQGDSVPHRIFVCVAWAYMIAFLVTVPFIGLLYLPYVSGPYERALCIVGIIYITVGAVFFLGIVGPILRASRSGQFRRELCVLPPGVDGGRILKCLYGWSRGCARCILPLAACCCDIPGLLYTYIRLRHEKDEEKRKGLERMRSFFFCASLVSVFGVLIVFFWVAMALWREEVLESSIAVQEAIGN